MSRSFTTKFILAFLLVGLVVIGLAAVFIWGTTSSQFTKYLVDQRQALFVSAVTDFYKANGNWAGVDANLRSQGLLPPPVQPGSTPPMPQPFALVDQNRVVIIPAGEYLLGEKIQKGVLAKGIRIESNGLGIGTVLNTGLAPTRSSLEDKYLIGVNRSLLIAAIGGALIALLLGFFIARSLTQPLRDLTAATRAMAQGELHQKVQIHSHDELGELAVSFNQMSADLSSANQSRRQMTADIAHDLRTPLTVIAGYVESLREGVLKPTPERFDTIYTEVQHLQRLVEDLRTLSQADAKELSLNRETLHLPALLERIAQSYLLLAARQKIRLKTEAEAGLPDLYADPDRLVQVFGNLISNSLRHTPSGGEIILFARREENDIVLGVFDSGSGIAQELLPHIFERFRSGDSARQEGGSGLGLAIAKAIVELHGGSISAESNSGKGTTVTIKFPKENPPSLHKKSVQ
jgi:two-component system sensor histidine kinase BaeS